MAHMSLLSVSGGALVPGANWFWYSSSCGGQYLGTNSSLIIYPTIDDYYFVRGEGSCNTTSCVSIFITISPAPAHLYLLQLIPVIFVLILLVLLSLLLQVDRWWSLLV